MCLCQSHLIQFQCQKKRMVSEVCSNVNLVLRIWNLEGQKILSKRYHYEKQQKCHPHIIEDKILVETLNLN